MTTFFLVALVLSANDALPRNADVFLESSLEVARAPLPAATRALVERGWVAHEEPRLGVPTVFWAMRLGADAPAWSRVELTPAEAARRYLLEYAALYRLSGEAVARLRTARVHDLGVGALVVSFARDVDGVPVFRDALHVVMTRERELVALTGFVNPSAAKASARAAFRLLPTTALEVAATDALGLTPAGAVVVREPDVSGWLRLSDARGRLSVARARRTWYGLPDALEPAWQVELADREGTAFLEVVSARDGRVLSRKNLSEDASATYRVWAEAMAPYAPDDSPYGTATTPYPSSQRLPPLTTTELPAALVTLDYGPTPRMDPWLPAGAQALEGNAVVATADLYEPDGFNPPDASLPDGGVLRLRDGGVPTPDLATPPTAPMRFDYAYDFGAEPAAPAQVHAATTQLFFTVNWLHDWLYRYGFDEAAGNGQTDNFGRGGLGNDALEAFAMDYSRPDNASMSTFGDGEPSRMQMGNFFAYGPYGASVGPLADAGTFGVARSNLGPRSYDVTGALVPMAVDGGLDGCDELLDPASLSGQVAFVVGNRCPVRAQVDRAQDAGAVGVLLALAPPTSGTYGVYFAPAGDESLPPVMALSGRDGFVVSSALDAGVALSARLHSTQPPQRPSALDNTVTTHEFGHFVSNRLVSDSAGLSLAISRSLGEGWSDFLALMQVVRAADAQAPSNAGWQGAWAVGAWVQAGTTPAGVPFEHHWYGLRRVPYSLDVAKNGLSFRHIRDGASLPPGAEVYGPNSEVHNAGEVWATMLWECFGALLVELQRPFAQAQDLMLRVLVASLKATPPNPDYLEARDAVLAVALAESRPVFEAMYRAFARRGAGPRAEAPSKLATNNGPVIEDFTVGDFVRVTSARVDDSLSWCDQDGVLDVGEAGVLHLTAKNLGLSAMSQPLSATVSAVTPGVAIIGSPVAVFSPAPSFGTSEADVQVRLDAATTVQQLEFRVDVPGSTTSLPTLVTVLSNFDNVPGATEDFEGPVTLDRGAGWRRGDDLVVSGFVDDQWQQRPLSPTSTVLWGPNPGSSGHTWVTTPALSVGTGPLTVRFKHRWQLEGTLASTAWDGAYLEVSDDGQQTWQPVTSLELTPAYNGAISTVGPTGDPVTNPEAGRAAWVDASLGYPAWVDQRLAFGTRFANKTIHLRFVLAADQNGARAGWDIDDVEVTGLVNAPFSQRVLDRRRCVNRAPTVSVVDSRRVEERQVVKLEAATADADGDTLRVQWLQVSGPTVALAGDTFTAPDVTQDTPLVFEVSVSDGALSASARATVVVVSVNRPPTLTASGPSGSVRAGQRIELVAEASDPDGDAVQVTWVQTRGPLAKALSPGVYEAPAAKEPARLYFEARASDGSASVSQEVDVGLEAAGCGCGAGGGGIGTVAFAAWVLLRRRQRRSAPPARASSTALKAPKGRPSSPAARLRSL